MVDISLKISPETFLQLSLVADEANKDVERIIAEAFAVYLAFHESKKRGNQFGELSEGKINDIRFDDER